MSMQGSFEEGPRLGRSGLDVTKRRAQGSEAKECDPRESVWDPCYVLKPRRLRVSLITFYRNFYQIPVFRQIFEISIFRLKLPAVRILVIFQK
jgi:hypothetical protein